MTQLALPVYRRNAHKGQQQQMGAVSAAQFLQDLTVIRGGQFRHGGGVCPLPQSAAGRAGGQVGFYQRFTFRAGYAVLHQRHQVAADRAGDFFDFGSFFHRS